MTKTEEKATAGTAAPPASPAKDSRTPTKQPRLAGKMKEPVYLIHEGNYKITVPAITREYVDTDEESETFGSVLTEEVAPEHEAGGKLPKGSRFGSRRVGVAHEIWDKDEAERLKKRGFRVATKDEIEKSERESPSKRVDELAASERERARRNLRKLEGRGARSDEGDRS